MTRNERDNSGFRRYPLQATYCRQLGQGCALNGTAREAVIEALKRDGYREDGVTMRAVLASYDKQKAAG